MFAKAAYSIVIKHLLSEKMKLLIVESPSKAKTINQYLGKEYEVISSYGHIRGLPSENGSVRPEEDFNMRFEILGERSEKHMLDIVKKSKNCEELLLATDPDREGEAISWHILEELYKRNALPKSVPVKRVVFHEITKKAILDAVANPRHINQNLVEAQQARQALDYLVGFTLSPVLWRKLPGSRSAGRVQSVALRAVSEREGEIEKFKVQEYWSVSAHFVTKDGKSLEAKLTHLQGEKLEKFSLPDQKSASAAVEMLGDLPYQVLKVEKKQNKRNPPPPFTTSTMLQDASRKLGFSTKKTAKIAQDLYEGMSVNGKTVGLITYMRTDSVSVAQDALDSSRRLIEQHFGAQYVEPKIRIFPNKTKNAQEAHEAIRPTDLSLIPDDIKTSLDADHYKLYKLIWSRMMASQMSQAIIDIVSVDIEAGNGDGVFRASGSTIKFDGFLKLYVVDEKEEENVLPVLNASDVLGVENIKANQHFTEPPPRYTEASLVKKLEELGIGRPSTYPAIIAVLQDRGYVSLENKRFFAMPKGRMVSAFLESFFAKYVEYDFTANLEDELDAISNGKINYKKVLRNFWLPFKQNIDATMDVKTVQVLDTMESLLHDYLFGSADSKCNKCGIGFMKLKTGKFGPFLGCSNYPECNNIKKLGDDDKEQEEVSAATDQFPKSLGLDENGVEYVIKKGPYGVYVEHNVLGEIKRTKVPDGKKLEDINIEFVKAITALPRIVGESQKYGIIKAGSGRFGPYVQYEKKYVSIKADPITITLSDAEQAIDRKLSKASKNEK